MKRSLRLLELLQLLRTYRKPVSAATLARILEITPRTIYRDIDTLREQGNDIQGEGGIGYVLISDNHLPPLNFTLDELYTLVLGLSWVRGHGDASLGNISEHIYAKIAAVIPNQLKGTLTDAPLMIASCHQYSDIETEHALTLRRAINQERMIDITYRDSKGIVTKRTIYPLAVGFLDDMQIFAAWCELRCDFRHFMLDGIVNLCVLDSKYHPNRSYLLRRLKHESEIFPPLD